MTGTASTAKRAAFGLAKVSGLVALARLWHRRRAVVLTYHSVLHASDIFDDYLCRNVVEASIFDLQMRWLSTRCRCLPLSELVDRLSSGGSLPPHTAAVTFDDGFRNNVQVALPILERHRVPATIFLTTSFIGQGTRMLWTERVGWMIRATPATEVVISLPDGQVRLDLSTSSNREEASRGLLRRLKGLAPSVREEIVSGLDERLPVPAAGPPAPRYAFLDWREAKACGPDLEFGSHTVTHPILSRLSEGESVREIVASKAAIEDHLGRPCRLFAYPNGTRDDFSAREQAILERAGYAGAVSQIPGVNDASTGRYELRRLNIGLGHVGPVFDAHASGLMSLLPGARRG
jgi:peptidoglycan/xylan/chitin deacetylase (PgdA/CDA1 family)